jgi:hypothetical protein
MHGHVSRVDYSICNKIRGGRGECASGVRDGRSVMVASVVWVVDEVCGDGVDGGNGGVVREFAGNLGGSGG